MVQRLRDVVEKKDGTIQHNFIKVLDPETQKLKPKAFYSREHFEGWYEKRLRLRLKE